MRQNETIREKFHQRSSFSIKMKPNGRVSLEKLNFEFFRTEGVKWPQKRESREYDLTEVVFQGLKVVGTLGKGVRDEER